MGKPDGRVYLENLGMDGTIILRWNFEYWNGMHGLF
jgi:hypothetical protein